MDFLLKLLRLGRRIHDLMWDWILRINTRGRIEAMNHSSKNHDNLAAESSAYNILHRIFRTIPLQKRDVFADYGCGKGRVVCYVSRFPMRKVIGIELLPEIATVAKCNSQKVSKRIAEIEIIEGDVLDFDCGEVTIFFFFNPFGAATMQGVLKRIETSLSKNPRHISIIYFNSTEASVFETCDFLVKRDELCIMRRGRPIVEFFQNRISN